MIHPEEFRLGNLLMQKKAGKISIVTCNLQHFELIAQGGLQDLYPVVLKPQLLEQCGFIENMDYPLLPQAREFVLVLPVQGQNKNEIHAYVKNNQECFARAMINGLPVSNNIIHLHQLQNLYQALTGKELDIRIK